MSCGRGGTREKPSPSTEATCSWPEPSDPLGFAGNEGAAIDESNGSNGRIATTDSGIAVVRRIAHA